MQFRFAWGRQRPPHGRQKVKIKETNPNRLALCVMLAGGNHTAGALLERAVYWKQYGAAAIPNVEGKWIANPRLWWMREAHLSSANMIGQAPSSRTRALLKNVNGGSD